MFEEEDIRENIITYDDEGGGEEDTEAFDIATLQVCKDTLGHKDTNKGQKENGIQTYFLIDTLSMKLKFLSMKKDTHI